MTLAPEWQAVLLFAFVVVLTISAGARLIPFLARRSLGQSAYEDAPQTHAVKSGTPTMGGLLFVLALLVVVVLHFAAIWVLALAGLGLGCAAIGFVDDLIAIRGGRNRGLRARVKLAATAVVAVAFLLFAWHAAGAGFGVLWVWPGREILISETVWFALGLATIVATTHAVNLTDGLDGLAAGTVLPPLLVLTWIAWYTNSPSIVWVDLAIAAAVLGFLAFNRFPARLIMGDTGSLLLGGILAGTAILLGAQLLLVLIGVVFVAEALSVILQVTSFKLTGKRIFRMSPLHHHFELGGWPETKVTYVFWGASGACSALGAALYAGLGR
jgi:phospho-N-acetylmuramoyl-pentapeptide-transferase